MVENNSNSEDEQLDEDLQKMLDEFTEEEERAEDHSTDTDPEYQEPEEHGDSSLDLDLELAEEQPEPEDDSIANSKPNQIISVDKKKQEAKTESQVTDDKRIEEILNKFNVIGDEIHNYIKSDRQKIDEVIHLFMDRIENPEAKTAYVEAITSLLSTKVMTSGHATRLLDSMTKSITATKNLNQGGGSVELNELLGGDDSEGFDEANP